MVAVVSRDAGTIFCGLSTLSGLILVLNASRLCTQYSDLGLWCVCVRRRRSYANGLVAVAHPSVPERITCSPT